MRFIFADSLSKLEHYTENGWLYFFLTRLQPNDRQAFVKFGLTERSLIERLEDYRSLNIANIYAIRTPCEEVSIRECAMRKVFLECKFNDKINIWKDHGIEFLKGDLDTMLRVFLYFCTSSLDEATAYKTKERVVDSENILLWLNALPSVESYKFNRLSSWKSHKMNPEIDNILDVTEEMIRSISVPEIVPTCVTVKTKNNTSVSSSEYVCDKCGKECKDKRGLGIHYNKCNSERHSICEFCNVEFSNAYNLSVHVSRCKALKSQKENIAKEEMTTIHKELILQKERNIELQSELEEMTEQYNSSMSQMEEIKRKIQSEFYEQIYLKDAEIRRLSALVSSQEDKISELEVLLEESCVSTGESEINEEYTMFTESLSTSLLTDISLWMQKSFYELGRFISKNMEDHYHLMSDSKDELYIMIHSDNEYNKRVSVKNLKYYIETIVTPYIEEEQVNNILDRAVENKIDRIKTMYRYIKNPTLKETEEIMIGLVSN